MYIRVLKALPVTGWRQKRSVMQRYNLTSHMYEERYREEQEAKYAAALDGLNLTPGSKVLDVGCGTGLFLSHITSCVDTAVGVDVSKQLLLIAKKCTKNLGNVLLVLADADHLPFKEAVFGFVFTFTVLQNMPKPEVTLKQIRKVAAMDACFVVTGLKATVSLEAFGELLDASGLLPTSLKNGDALRCHVVQCIQRQ
ncbi:MAG: methyltransferase domain-containing protein [Candidatus Bathyarchaeota archaeon]|nr:methyltransferase domain-containing protein [Candidatus Bathyarchaeota archaeon]